MNVAKRLNNLDAAAAPLHVENLHAVDRPAIPTGEPRKMKLRSLPVVAILATLALTLSMGAANEARAQGEGPRTVEEPYPDAWTACEAGLPAAWDLERAESRPRVTLLVISAIDCIYTTDGGDTFSRSSIPRDYACDIVYDDATWFVGLPHGNGRWTALPGGDFTRPTTCRRASVGPPAATGLDGSGYAWYGQLGASWQQSQGVFDGNLDYWEIRFKTSSGYVRGQEWRAGQQNSLALDNVNVNHHCQFQVRGWSWYGPGDWSAWQDIDWHGPNNC